MATTNVNNFDTIEEWRLKTNELGVKIADLDNNLFTINVIASGNITASGNINALGNVVVTRDAVVSGNVLVSRDTVVSGNIVGASNAIITGNVIAANVLANVHYGTYVTSKPAINVLFNANITGSANLLLSSSGTNILTISANVAADSVTLGTHTIGNYVKEISSADTANIIVNSGVGEGTTPTVNLAMTNVTPGVYGNTNAVSTFTVTKDGRITNASNLLIDRAYALVTNKPSMNVRFLGNIVGNANLLLSSEGTNFLEVYANVAADSVTLGTHTVGDFVKSISSADTSNIIVNSGSGESSTPTVNLAMTNVTPGSYGNANAVSSFTVTKDGRLTASSNLLIDRAYILTTGKPSINLSFTGDVTGSGSVNLSNENTNSLSIGLTVAADSVALGTDTTGNYVENLVQGSGITLTNATPAEQGKPTISANVTSVGSFLGAVSNTNLLSSILQVDGSGSLLDADFLDGQHGTYYLDWTNQTNKPAINVLFNANITGSANVLLTNSGTNILTISANVANDSVTLGTHTIGDYVKTVSQGSGIAVTGGTGEGSTPTIALATSGVTAASYGNANAVPQITVDTFGRITSASNLLIDRRYTTVTEKPSINLRFVGDATGAGNINISQTNTNDLAITMTVSSVGSGTLPTTTVTPGTYGGGNTYAAFTVDSTGRLTAASNVALADTGVTAGSYGNANAVSLVTVDSKGRVTAASNLLIDRAYTLTTGKPSVNLTFTGDVTGTGSINLANENTNSLSIGLTIAADSIALGTDTTGNYTDRVVGGTGLTATGTANEGNVITVGLTNTGVAATTYGNARVIPSFTVDAQGRITSASNITMGSDVANIVLTGDVTGSANVVLGPNSTSISIATTIAADSIALGTDTTGNYTNRVEPGTMITVSGTADEGNVITINHFDTSTLNGLQGGSGIASITVDDRGHVTAVTTATYCTSVPVSSNVFSYFGAGGNTISQTNSTHSAINSTGFNFFAGRCAAQAITTGVNNIIFGSCAARCITTGCNNFFAGFCAGHCSTDTAFNIYIGQCAGFCGNGSYNTFLGIEAGKCNSGGFGSIYIGARAGCLGCGNDNIFLGRNAGRNATGSCENIFLGCDAGRCDMSSRCNIFAGTCAGFYNTVGCDNISLGACAGWYNQQGNRNIFLGRRTGGNIISGSDNIILGCLNTNNGLTGSTSNVIIMATGGIQRFEVDPNLHNFFAGTCAGFATSTGSCNTFIGYLTGQCHTTGIHNTFIGYIAGANTTFGSYNIFTGRAAGYCNTTGGCNVALGRGAGFGNTTGNNNLFFGYGAGFCNVSGNFNSFSGMYAGKYNCTGCYNIFEGERTGFANTTGCCNIFIGRRAGYYNSNGSNNTFLGAFAGYKNTSGTNNNFFGTNAGCYNTTGANNNFFGLNAGYYNTTGGCNVFLGSQAGCRNTTGCFNVFIGINAGRCNTTGNNNIFLGCGAGYGATGLINNTTGCNQIVLGNSSHTVSCIQTAWTVPSDIRDKCIFGPVPHGKCFLNNINPITFSFKNRETNELKDNRKRYGFSAQEVLAAEGEDPVIVGTENPDKLGFTSDFIIPILVNAVKELTKDVEELRAEIAELKKSR